MRLPYIVYHMPHLPAEYAFASADMLAAARALDDFKRGHPVLVEEETQALLCAPAEQLSAAQLEALTNVGDCALLLPATLATRLGYGYSDAADVKISGGAAALYAIITDGGSTTSQPTSHNLTLTSASSLESAAIGFAKQGSVLPILAAVLLTKPIAAKARALIELWQAARLSPEQVSTEQVPLLADLITTPISNLPLEVSAGARAFAFRLRQQPQWHLAVLFGEPAQAKAPLVRIHSSCLTGDLLGSLRCDCGSQLHSALCQMAASEGGVLLYMSQEGRGIGIGNKIRAYHLQDGGMDTREANESLGFDADARDYGLAALVLKSLKLPPIRLMTNNPRKVEALTRHRLAVRERVPLRVEPGEHNHRYLEAKAQKLGHMLE